VTAIEPLPEMLELLPAAAPGAKAVLGNAEVIPLPDAYADVVTAAQAFHWFDHEVALLEIARVLRPAGRLGLVWNVRDDSEAWVGEFSTLIGSESVTLPDVSEPLAASGVFGQLEMESFRFTQVLDRTTLLDLVVSRSYCAKLPPAERKPILDDVERLFGEHAVDGEIELPYVTECYRAAKTS
jgi:SAM-dependent methyltransferase